MRSIRGRFKKLITIFGCTKTFEDYPDFFAQLIVGEKNYLVTPAIEHRAVDPLTYRKNLPFPTTIITDLPALLRQLDSTPPDTLIIVYGSLYLVGEVIESYTPEKYSL